ncbi:methenyltetrahydromethanopterin cyclohydrolase [Candidatus Bathyarchaeota archaeon]|nr:methenyltetrahydromethanopterin cyclohydrolase [Candidatus Bathyarchaeota archaeon]
MSKKAEISLNIKARRIVNKLMDDENRLGVSVYASGDGSTIIDAGVEAEGSFEAGLLVTEICMGGMGRARMGLEEYDRLMLPTVFVETSRPCEALLGSQFAGWRIEVEDYYAMASGPARALALKPKKIFEEIQYREEADEAVIVLESDKLPTPKALRHIAEKCSVNPDRLYAVVTPTSSLVGSVQISGRIAETGMHRLVTLGLDPKVFKHAAGKAPVAPSHPDSKIAMGRTNDVLLYGGETFFIVEADMDEERLREIVDKAPSSSSRDYGKPFYEIFRDAGYDFYKIDPALFAPAALTLCNLKDGKVYSAGTVNREVLRKAMGC